MLILFICHKPHKDEKTTVLLIGNKCDNANARLVPHETGEQFAKSQHLLFHETSALTGEHVQEAFAMLVKHILTHNPDYKKYLTPVSDESDDVEKQLEQEQEHSMAGDSTTPQHKRTNSRLKAEAEEQRAQEMQAEMHVNLDKPEKPVINKKKTVLLKKKA